MVEDEARSQRCRFCHSSFSLEVLNKIEDGKRDVYCEHCGDVIKRVNDKYDFNPPDNTENEPKTMIVYQPANPRKVRKKMKPNPDAFNFPIGRIFYDIEFPLTFKSNFIIVFSRLICASALRLEEAGLIDFSDPEPTDDAINDLYMATRVVQNKRIKPEFLNNLRDASIEEFEGNLKKLQAKIQSNRQFMEDFHVYSRWLLRRVFVIIAENKPDEQLTTFEKTILNDLHLLTFDGLKLPPRRKMTSDEKNDELEIAREELEPEITQDSQKNLITYEEYLALIETREDISARMNRVDFYTTLVNQAGAVQSEIAINWKCTKKNHDWQASYNSVRSGDGCPRCPKGTKVNIAMTKDPPSDPSINNVNIWFTNTLLETMKQYSFLKKYASLRKMSLFFGLTKNYLYDKRYKKSVISHDYLDTMEKSVVENMTNSKLLSISSNEIIKEAQNRLLSIIEAYRGSYDPKLTANTQINKELKTTYFHNIETLQQAYYLGLLFADGWISIQHSSGGSTAYRIGLSLKVEDKAVIERFSMAIGLSKDRVLERDCEDLKSGVVYRMAYLQFGAGSTSLSNSMAKDLIKMGITYQITKTGRRTKVPILPIFYDEEGVMLRELMLAFLLGYFDGDGTLKKSMAGAIYSNNYAFLTAIKNVFNLGELSKDKRLVYNPSANTYTEKHVYSLRLTKSIIKKMMSLGIVSMKRKSVNPELIKLDEPIITKQRIWLKKVLPINQLQQILTTHSPSKISELIGVDHNTLLKFIKKVYKLNSKEKGYYISLSYERKKSSAKSKLNGIYNERTQHLIEIGKKNPFKQ